MKTIHFGQIRKSLAKHKYKIVVAILSLCYFFCLPKELFTKNYSTVVYSREGKLLGAKIAYDHQWRFPKMDSVPYRFEKAIVESEDKYFYWHPGINPVAVAKALYANVKQGRIIRGGSTITQQVVRLWRGNKKRTYGEKAIEAILASRLELRYSKEEILNMYCSNAPFGGNIVGLEMACWRYYGISPEKISWAEAALLATLPNAPGLIYPGKNQDRLRKKRDRILYKLYKKGYIDKDTYQLSLLEDMPKKTYDLPQHAPHLVDGFYLSQNGEKIKTTIDYNIQKNTANIVENYYQIYKQAQIYNIAVLVSEVETGHVLAMVGNTPTDAQHKKNVNIIYSKRSTGSLLKPFLYAGLVESGELLPQQLVEDTPTNIGGYSPENYQMQYEGAVEADQALCRSLNVPFVLMLRDFGVGKFYHLLQKNGLKSIDKHPDHYGLSLILGGAESTMWEMSRAYLNMAQELEFYNRENLYRNNGLCDLSLKDTKKTQDKGKKEKNTFRAGAIFQTFEAMAKTNRPEGESGWKYYENSEKIAWKTGTSFGSRDAWAIGLTPKYVVAVWVGNATGEGRPNLTGAAMASPIMFDVFSFLPDSQWFKTPYEDLEEVETCSKSGFLAGENCPKKKTKVVFDTKGRKICPYHKVVHLSMDGKYQVDSSCEDIKNIKTQTWFALPSVMEWFYKKNHLDYKSLPPIKQGCNLELKNIDFIYPKHANKIYQVRSFGGQKEPFVAKVAAGEKRKVFWYVDNTYLGQTQDFHQMPIRVDCGIHFLKVIDNYGGEKTIMVEVKGGD